MFFSRVVVPVCADFLPVKCKNCEKMFCRDHAPFEHHSCPVKREAQVSTRYWGLARRFRASSETLSRSSRPERPYCASHLLIHSLLASVHW